MFSMSGSSKNQGCTVKGMCGKENTTANLQDLLIFNLKGIAVVAEASKAAGIKVPASVPAFVGQARCSPPSQMLILMTKIWLNGSTAPRPLKKELADAAGDKLGSDLHDCATWYSDDVSAFQAKAEAVCVLATENEDVRSLRELLILGLKGVAAYADHAAILGVEKQEIWDFMMEGMASTTKDLSVDDMVGLVLK